MCIRNPKGPRVEETFPTLTSDMQQLQVTFTCRFTQLMLMCCQMQLIREGTADEAASVTLAHVDQGSSQRVAFVRGSQWLLKGKQVIIRDRWKVKAQ